MSLLKSETTIKLDDLNRAGFEALGLYEDLASRLDDEPLQRLLAAHIEPQRSLLESVADLRRERGDLPQAADPERSHLEAVEAFVRAVVLAGGTEHYLESLLDAAGEVDRTLAEALSLELDDELRTLLEAFKSAHEDFEAAVRARLAELRG